MPFELMLRSGMREGISKRIQITTEDPSVISEVCRIDAPLNYSSIDYIFQMIRYFYTADANIKRETALPLLRLASLYQIDSLR